MRRLEQRFRLAVHERDRALTVEADQRDAHVLDQRFEVLMVRRALQIQAAELPRQQAIGRLEIAKHPALARDRQVYRKVAVCDE